MESFFLSETTKYLYLLFDPDNFLNNNGVEGTVIQTPNGECVIDAGGYVFNTEAHPVDPSALRCCHDVPRENLLAGYDHKKFLGDIVVFSTTAPDVRDAHDPENLDSEIMRVSNMTSLDIDKLLDTEQTKRDLLKLLQELKIRNERDMKEDDADIDANVMDSDDLIRPVDASEMDADSGQSEVTELNYNNHVTSEKKIENVTHSTRVDGNHQADEPQEILGVGEATVVSKSVNDINDRSEVFMGNKIVPPENRSDATLFPPYERRTLFDAQHFLKRIRKMYNDTNVDRDYELLSCKTQPYSQRLAVFGEVLND